MSSKSYSSVVQEDKSIQAAAEVGNIVGPEAIQAQPASVVLKDAPNTTLGDIVFNQFPEEVAATVGQLVESVDRAVGVTAQSTMASTAALGQKLQELQVGEAAALPKIVLYVVVGGGLLMLGTRLLNR